MNNIKKGKIGGPSRYEASFKRKVCAELLSGTITRNDLARKYGLPLGATVMRWVKWYEQEQEQLLTSQQMKEKQSEPDQQAEGRANDLKAVQEELRLARLKVFCLETMIDVAEQTLQIDIRKKSGTKSSPE